MPTARDIVLLFTHSGDYFTVERVAQEVSRRGLRPIRIDTDGFPSQWELTSMLGPTHEEVLLHTSQGEVRSSEVRSVWLRRLASPRLDETLEPAWRESCVRESSAALTGALDGLRGAGCRFINPLGADALAANKLFQLRLARAHGLEIPRTMVTNDAARVPSWFDEAGGRVVVKMLTVLSQSMEGGQPFMYTSAIGREHLDDLEGLRHSPMVFQERIDKAHELRVSVVGERCFVGAIDASGSARGQVDWRRARPDECSWTPGTLPEEVARRLVRLVAALGLVYGAADFIVTPDGRYVFLEVNPGGEWGMLERDLGLPIAAALADALVAEGSGPAQSP